MVALAGCSAGGGDGKECVPACDGRECGPDGCGGTCGYCPGEEGACTAEGQCTYGQDDASGTEPFDLALPPNASVEEKCERLEELYQAALVTASECESVVDCRHVVKNRLPCTCATFVTGDEVEGVLEPLVAEYKALDCLAGELCEVCPFIEVPGCVDGLCGTIKPTCADLSAAWTEALAQASQCKDDGDCSQLLEPEPGCGCDVPAGDGASAPFFDRAGQFAEINGCAPTGGCECGEGKPSCHAKTCIWK